ncbi:MAG: hypothetical protein HQL46_10050 [Gammaproteobacteria bacterium]|nr:hypothetical protein [Gammaproteobacteria bacterium]
METLSFIDRATLANEQQTSFYWIDVALEGIITRDELPQVLKTVIHEQHILDINNQIHPPIYEIIDEYEIIIFRTIDQRYDIITPQTRSTSFILINNTLITFHHIEDKTLTKQHHKWQVKKTGTPRDFQTLLHVLLNLIGSSYLELREPLNNQLQIWQQRLIDPNDPFNDWQVLLKAKSSLRWLKINLELQRDVLANWRTETHLTFDSMHQVSFNDLDNHFARIERLADAIRSDLDSLNNIYFASVSQSTNKVMQLIAALSAIFLPLNLIAAIFGMNFENMPLIKTLWGFSLVAIIMLALALLLVWVLRKKKWF